MYCFLKYSYHPPSDLPPDRVVAGFTGQHTDSGRCIAGRGTIAGRCTISGQHTQSHFSRTLILLPWLSRSSSVAWRNILSLSEFVCFYKWLLNISTDLGLFISVSELPPVSLSEGLKKSESSLEQALPFACRHWLSAKFGCIIT